MAAKNRRVFELRLGKLGLILFIGGMSVLLFSCFLLGIFVGKHMEAYPERYSTGIAELIRDRLLAASAPADGHASPATEQERKMDRPETEAEVRLDRFTRPWAGKRGERQRKRRPVQRKYKTSETFRRAVPSDGKCRGAGPPMAALGGTTVETNPPVSGGEGEGAERKSLRQGESSRPGTARIRKAAGGGDGGAQRRGVLRFRWPLTERERRRNRLMKKLSRSGLFVPGGDEGTSREGKMVSRDRGRI